MGMPAFLSLSAGAASTSSGAVPSLSPEVAEVCSTLWERARFAWATHPPEGTPVEEEALGATFALFLEVSRDLAGHPQAALRSYVNEGLRRVMREQRATAEDDRSFALRQLEQALEHYGVAIEALAVGAGLDDVFAQAADAADELRDVMPAELRPLYRAQGALLMAFEAMSGGPSEDLRCWAREAVERWRGVVADLPALTALVRGARAHIRARHAWDSWADDDRAVERNAWKALR